MGIMLLVGTVNDATTAITKMGTYDTNYAVFETLPSGIFSDPFKRIRAHDLVDLMRYDIEGKNRGDETSYTPRFGVHNQNFGTPQKTTQDKLEIQEGHKDVIKHRKCFMRMKTFSNFNKRQK